MNLLSNEKAQVGAIWVVLLGIFILGIMYVSMGKMMDNVQTTNNDLINDSSMHYTQDHVDAMTGIFDFFWGLPFYFVFLLICYGVVQAMRKQPGQV